MTDSMISDDVYKIGVLSGILGGLGLYTYTQFIKKKSYLVEWSALVKTAKGSNTTKDVSFNEDGQTDPSEDLHDVEKLVGSETFSERYKNHQQLINHIFQRVILEKPEYKDLKPENVQINILHVHVL